MLQQSAAACLLRLLDAAPHRLCGIYSRRLSWLLRWLQVRTAEELGGPHSIAGQRLHLPLLLRLQTSDAAVRRSMAGVFGIAAAAAATQAGGNGDAVAMAVRVLVHFITTAPGASTDARHSAVDLRCVSMCVVNCSRGSRARFPVAATALFLRSASSCLAHQARLCML